jgi:hypothetical protein
VGSYSRVKMSKKGSLTFKSMKTKQVRLKTLGTSYLVTYQKHGDHAESNLLAIILTDLTVIVIGK